VHRRLWDTARAAAEAAGRDPDGLRRELRVNLEHGQTPDDAVRALADAERLGVDGVFFDFMDVAETVPQMLGLAEKIQRIRTG
jgi:alkanesulfonate monooxygenase SsuD/methylene tetrahydromethanopterin reductase-like flavin-dependent oxidoreductase (luciferase family)